MKLCLFLVYFCRQHGYVLTISESLQDGNKKQLGIDKIITFIPG